MKRLLISLALSILFACAFKRHLTQNVVVPGNAPEAEKMRVAQSVGRDLYEHKLKPELKARFGYTDAQVQGVFVRANAMRYKNIVGNAMPSEPVVTLSVGIEFSGDLPNADAAVDYCADLAKKELAARMSQRG